MAWGRFGVSLTLAMSARAGPASRPSEAIAWSTCAASTADGIARSRPSARRETSRSPPAPAAAGSQVAVSTAARREGHAGAPRRARARRRSRRRRRRWRGSRRTAGPRGAGPGRPRQEPRCHEPARNRGNEDPLGAGEEQHDATAAARATARGSTLGSWGSVAENATIPHYLRRERAPSRCGRARAPSSSRCHARRPPPVHQHLHRAREGCPCEQARERQRQRVRRAHLDPEAAADRVVGSRVGVEAAGDHPDENAVVAALCTRRTTAHARSCGRSRHRSRVQAADHRGAQRLGEWNAEARGADDGDCLGIAARSRRSRPGRRGRSATRASATPPASAIQNRRSARHAPPGTRRRPRAPARPPPGRTEPFAGEAVGMRATVAGSARP